MKRIVITGMAGSGKSTLACQMASILSTEVYHMDAILWGRNWKKRSQLEWTKTLREIVEKDSWVIEGKGKLDTRKIAYDIQFPMADAIIFLDFNKYFCLWRICKRSLQCFGKHKAELSPEYPERWRGSLALLKRVWKNFSKERISILKDLNKYSDSGKDNIFIMKRSAEVDVFLKNLYDSSA